MNTNKKISIHAPTRGATGWIDNLGDEICNFNPRSYKRSDPLEINFLVRIIISIHAPTRGATQDGTKEYVDNQISIHAPTRGATNRWLRQ